MTGTHDDTSRVFLVWHNRTPEDDDNAKLLGVFSSRGQAESRIQRANTQPGFADFPDCFIIDEYEVDTDQWREGFITME